MSDENYRREIFIENYKCILEFNSENHFYKQGINQFSDLTIDEMKEYSLKGITPDGLDEHTGVRYSAEELYGPSNNTKQGGEHLDYRDSGSVTPIKHQGRCGSCWAFSVAGSIEGTNHRTKNQLNGLSEQELVDCFKGDCNGQYPGDAFDYLIRNRRHARDSSSCYPYMSSNGRASACKTYGNECVGANPSRKITTRRGNENDLKAHLDRAGPISITMYWPESMYQFYGKKEIVEDPNCRRNAKDGTHAVTLVGYGNENGRLYWLLKNSWGTDWGDQGYFKLARNRNNQCNVATWAMYAQVS